MIEIEYAIGELQTAMFVADDHPFYLVTKQWVNAKALNSGDKILACDSSVAQVVTIKRIPGNHVCQNLKISHNHNYFVSTDRALGFSPSCDQAPSDALELVAYQLANKPSHLPDGKPTGFHSGPWVAAKYCGSGPEVIGWGRANDNMCAEDAAVSDLRGKLGNTVILHRGNVEISHAYIRKYTKKGRFVNKMSPCSHCRNNYGNSLNDRTMGTSDLVKDGRDFLPASPK
ncbi:polymorphic toxin-type HINT domain-containing protein [Shewanella youngdeokensis]|uniref:Polymorphic toxin-type HINT domain-containing protein n=1 Tax=Shewanella youngdeokensis TaxID=2999068 RepID=A0ABZ0JWR7_9GAMM|nr:polymorphic toxin-type HINT domain-containing protein [Shewanella sp. DAU334]